jgi:hypothetical protein
MIKTQSTKLRANRRRPLQEKEHSLINRWTPVAAFTGLILSVPMAGKTLYEAFRIKSDALTIQVASYEQEGKYINIGVVYSNTGDYTETVDSVTSLIGLTEHPSEQVLPLEQGRCIKPISVKAGETVMVRYRVLFNTNDSRIIPLPEFDRTKFPAMLDFDVVHRSQGVLHQRVFIGDLTPWNKGPFSGDVNFSFETKKFPVDFTIGAPRITLGTYPQPPEFIIPDTCSS